MSQLTRNNDLYQPLKGRPDSESVSASGKAAVDETRQDDKARGARPYYSAALFAFFIFVLINLIVAPLAPRTKRELTKSEILTSHCEAMHQGPWSWWIARTVLSKRPADVALMGDSQINAAVFQADAFASMRPRDCAADRESLSLEQLLAAATGRSNAVINLAVGGAVASDQYMISKALFPRSTPKIVVVGVSPRCFIDDTLPSASATDPFQFFEPYVEMGSLAHLAFPNSFSELAWRFKSYVPMLALHDPVCGYLAVQAKLHQPNGKSMALNALNDRAETQPRMLRGIYASASDVKQSEIFVTPTIVQGFYDNTPEYQRRYRNLTPPAYKIQQKFFHAYLDNLSSLGIKTVVVGMPCTKLNRQLLPEQFWSEYRAWLTSECSGHRAIWFDLSDDPAFPRKYFLDTVHVNAFGARVLVQKIAALLMTDPTLSRELKSSDAEMLSSRVKHPQNSAHRVNEARKPI
jgi:hypothetical protein